MDFMGSACKAPAVASTTRHHHARVEAARLALRSALPHARERLVRHPVPAIWTRQTQRCCGRIALRGRRAFDFGGALRSGWLLIAALRGGGTTGRRRDLRDGLPPARTSPRGDAELRSWSARPTCWRIGRTASATDEFTDRWRRGRPHLKLWEERFGRTLPGLGQEPGQSLKAPNRLRDIGACVTGMHGRPSRAVKKLVWASPSCRRLTLSVGRRHGHPLLVLAAALESLRAATPPDGRGDLHLPMGRRVVLRTTRRWRLQPPGPWPIRSPTVRLSPIPSSWLARQLQPSRRGVRSRRGCRARRLPQRGMEVRVRRLQGRSSGAVTAAVPGVDGRCAVDDMEPSPWPTPPARW